MATAGNGTRSRASSAFDTRRFTTSGHFCAANPTDASVEPASESTKQETATEGMDVDPASTATETGASADTSAAPAAPKPALPPVVHSWQYDEIVFPEPMEPFYDILSTNPPTPMPATSALAFTDPSAYRSYQYALTEAVKNGSNPPIPPHPLHTPTGYLFDALSFEAQQAEADRLDMARIAAIRELEKSRDQLIKSEKALKDARNRIASLNNAALASGGPSGTAVPPAT